jgi:hypothetical protein
LSSGAGLATEERANGVRIDDLALALDDVAKSDFGEAVKVAVNAAAVLVQQFGGLAGEELPVGAGHLESTLQALGGVVGADRGDAQACVEPREQRLVCREAKAVLEFGQADEDDREQSLRVPLVVQQDVVLAQLDEDFRSPPAWRKACGGAAMSGGVANRPA